MSEQRPADVEATSVENKINKIRKLCMGGYDGNTAKDIEFLTALILKDIRQARFPHEDEFKAALFPALPEFRDHFILMAAFHWLRNKTKGHE